MPTPESIESALARLMPPALSDAGREAIESMLDDLAASTPLPRRSFRPARWVAAAGMAAAAAGLVVWAHLTPPSAPALVAAPAPPPVADQPPGMILISETEQVEDLYDDGMLATPDGGAVQAVRSRVVGASRFLDEETGIEVIVSQPREETVLIPVSHF
jgi:hypothetical protein